MAVPSRGNYSCSVTGECAAAAVSPRPPRGFDFYAGQVFKECPVICRLNRLAKPTDMPGAGHHRDVPFKLLECRPYVGAHESLALIVARYVIGRLRARGFLRAGLCHCRLDRREY